MAHEHRIAMDFVTQTIQHIRQLVNICIQWCRTLDMSQGSWIREAGTFLSSGHHVLMYLPSGS